MNVLVVENCVRAYALAWTAGHSPLGDRFFVAPGNGGPGLGTVSVLVAIVFRDLH